MFSAPRVFVWDDHPVVVSHGLPRPLHALRIERYIGTPMRIQILRLVTVWCLQLSCTFAQEVAKTKAANPDPLFTAESDCILKDFHFVDGETLPELKLHYRTIGQPASDSAAGEVKNAVLLLHGTTGTGKEFLSMGGMHTWLCGELYPALMDAIIPVACQPDKIAGRNLLWRRIITTAVRSDPEWNDSEYKRPPSSLARVYPIFELMTGNATQLQQELGSVEQVNARLESIVEFCRSGQIDANDLVHRFEASADYDPAPDLEKIQASVLAINFADDELNPPQLGIVDRAMPRLRNGQFVLVPASSQTQGHMTLRKASIYAPFVADFLAKLPTSH
jgi:homoserine acetyltransferase